MNKTILLLSLLIIPFIGNAQKIGAGLSGMYNFQTESVGFGARVNFLPNSTISYVPQFTYYPGIGPISEYMIGLGIEAKIIRGNTFNYYIMAHGAYNEWLNPEDSGMEGAEATNWNLEAGVGITTNRCLRPFLEYRYNIYFQETHLRFGLLYIFGCNARGDGYRDVRRVRNATNCTGF